MDAHKHFGTTNLYKILQVDVNAHISEVKKNYYRLALINHPDRVPDHEKSDAKEKFTIIHQAYTILSDSKQKEMYDNGNDVLFTKATVSGEWERFLKPANNTDMENARMIYQNSKEEESAIEREYIVGKGSLTHILNNVPFMRVEDETRIIAIIHNLIESGTIPKFKLTKIKK